MFTRIHREDDGAVLIIAIALAAIISVYALLVFATLQTSQDQSRRTRNVTSARGAADAGAEDIIFDLGISGESGTPWDTYVTTHTDPVAAYNALTDAEKANSEAHQIFVEDLGEARYYVTVTADPSNAKQHFVWVKGEYPAGSGDFSELKVTVKRGAPQAFNFAMFADTAIDVHHHGPVMAPIMTTTRVHSNGDISLPASSEMNGETITAVGTVALKGGTGNVSDVPNLNAAAANGNYGIEGFTWRYDIGPHNRCIPSWNPDKTSAHFGDVSAPETPYADHAGNGCDRRWFPGTAEVTGDILADSVEIGGMVRAGGERKTEAMVDMAAKDGHVFVSNEGGAKIGGSSVNGSPGDVIDCANCNRTTEALGTIQGKVHITDEGPQPIVFPSIDYEETYRPRAQRQQDNACLAGEPCSLLDGGKQHVFASSSAWLTYITNPANGFYRYIDNSGNHKVWPKNNGFPPEYILLRGDWYIENGIKLSAEGVNQAVDDAVPDSDKFDEDDPTMPIVVAGTVVSPDGGADMKGRLYLVGRGNRTDFLEEDPLSDYNGDGEPDDVRVNVCRFLNKANKPAGSSTCGSDLGPLAGFDIVEPGVLAGTSQSASDVDRDDPWENDGDYEPNNVNATWVRGLVYAGEWDDDESMSEAGDHHWHSADPKNQVRIFGSQIGGKLHNCNNFEFTYDDVVLNAFGFTGGGAGVEIVAWDEI